VESPYIKRLFMIARKAGWVAILMHYRGCSGEPNRTIRRYHSGETSDTDFLVCYLKQRFPKAPLFAIGFSLGGNALLKYQGEQQEKSLLRAAIAISVPFKLDSCAAKLETGFSRIYQKYLMSHLKNNIKKKMSLLDYSDYVSLSLDQIDRLKTFREFDEYVTAPIHGFKGADDYYEQCSSRQYLKNIKNRTLIIQAKDDPFISEDAIPTSKELSEKVTLELSDKGGHVGFISGGSIFSPQYWLEKRILNFIQDRLANRID
jgi:predicted alpha/beta-fold hydrolase